jgi:ankyrin repeat protein
MYAAYYNHTGCVWELLRTGKVDPNTKNPCGITALSWGSMHGSYKAVNMLLAAGTNPNIIDNWGETALIKACG